MHPYPHHYQATATSGADGDVTLTARGLPPIESAAPIEFDGPGNRWSPEALLIAAVSDCFILSFRAVSRAARLQWLRLECTTEGTLDKAEGITRFTEMRTTATLHVHAGTDSELARRMLEKAERVCLINNSLLANKHLEAKIVVVP